MRPSLLAGFVVVSSLAGCMPEASNGRRVSDDLLPQGCESTSSLTFTVVPAPGDPNDYCLGTPATCSGAWLRILGADGVTPLALDAPCSTPCDTCEAVACPTICALPPRLGAGRSRAWDGTHFVDSTCGGGACVSPACAPAGEYVAEVCWFQGDGVDASPGTCATATSARTCRRVAFRWPPATDEVRLYAGTVADAGGADAATDVATPCCPAGHTLYGCSFDDGGAGLACHDPALGCASSTTCGQGCDPVVSGRCAR